MSQTRIVVVGGGAAGFFAAITCAEASREAEVMLLEKGPRFLAKVRISGGGRCNVTHACFDPVDLAEYYPRGGKELPGILRLFQPRDVIEWFETRGVRLKTEADGRIFPVTDSSETIIECLIGAAESAGVRLFVNRGVDLATRRPGGGFAVELHDGKMIECDRLMLATGGCRSAAAGQLAVSLGHTLEPPVPSLFTFHVKEPWLHALAGISVPSLELAVPELRLAARGAGLITHAGLSGPATLRLSAWGARVMHALDYRFLLRINWLPNFNEESLASDLEQRRSRQSARLIANSPIPPLAARLWEALVEAAGIPRQTRWAELSRADRHRLVRQLRQTEVQVVGKTLNQEEFVTCGGVRLNEVETKTMESRVCPGLFFGGELLDIDGLTGGFNFQSAWSTGWIAGKAMAR
jgi:predicted Rossmann fold flavoprotein